MAGMSRRMDHALDFDAPAEKIYQDFADREFWEALMEAYRWLKTDSQLTEFTTGESGTDIVFRQVLPRSELPPVARAVMPVDMVVTREQHFAPYDHQTNQAEGSYRATIPAGLGHFGGRYFLTETATGSRLRLASVCKVHIPFVGGTLEQLILSNITGLFDAEGTFMADWVSRHH
jgi:hypothetical protein